MQEVGYVTHSFFLLKYKMPGKRELILFKFFCYDLYVELFIALLNDSARHYME